MAEREELARKGVLDELFKSAPKEIVFPEGEAEKIVRAAKILVNEGLCRPVLLGDRATIESRLVEHELPADAVEVVDPATDQRTTRYAERLQEMRWRKGVTAVTAAKLMRDPVYFGNMMVHEGDADGLIAGLTMSYPETIRPALQIHKTLKGVRKACGVYLLLFEDRMLFIADTTVNQDPTAEDLAEIAHMAAAVAQTYFDEEPRVAMLSYSNFGSNVDDRTRKIRFFQRDAYVSIDTGAREAEVYRLVRSPDRGAAIEGGKIPVPDREPLREELQDFVDAVRFGRAPLVGGADGRRAVALAADITSQMAANAAP